MLLNMSAGFNNVMACRALRSVTLENIRREGVSTGLNSTTMAAAFHTETLL